jgi:hypothetical protein
MNSRQSYLGGKLMNHMKRVKSGRGSFLDRQLASRWSPGPNTSKNPTKILQVSVRLGLQLLPLSLVLALGRGRDCISNSQLLVPRVIFASLPLAPSPIDSSAIRLFSSASGADGSR